MTGNKTKIGKYVVLPTLWVKDDVYKTQKELEKLGLGFNEETAEEDTEIKNVAFFEIDLITEYPYEEKQYSTISSNGETYVVALSFEEVLTRVDNVIFSR